LSKAPAARAQEAVEDLLELSIVRSGHDILADLDIYTYLTPS
jgi:hypothetical protein